MTRRTEAQRIAALAPALRRGTAFRARVAEAAGDTIRLADLMAEAIGMAREARGLEVVGRDGRAMWCVEELEAAACMDAAAAAYRLARGANQ